LGTVEQSLTRDNTPDTLNIAIKRNEASNSVWKITLALTFSGLVSRAVPDFGYSSSRKPAISTNLAQIQLQLKCSWISVFW
jgi:hypothetical protein